MLEGQCGLSDSSDCRICFFVSSGCQGVRESGWVVRLSNDNPISMIRQASNENVSVPAACHPVPVLPCKDENKHDCLVQRVFLGCRPDGKPLSNPRCTFSLENGSMEIPCKHILQVPRESQLKHLQAYSRIRIGFPAQKPDESLNANNRILERCT